MSLPPSLPRVRASDCEAPLKTEKFSADGWATMDGGAAAGGITVSATGTSIEACAGSLLATHSVAAWSPSPSAAASSAIATCAVVPGGTLPVAPPRPSQATSPGCAQPPSLTP